MTRSGLRLWPAVCFVVSSLALCSQQSTAVPLDKEGDIKLGVRTYVNARIGTEDTHDGYPQCNTPNCTPQSTVNYPLSGTFPHSDSGHLRQNRFYVEAELNYDADRLLQQGVGPFSLLNTLPFKVKDLGFHFTFRGEYDGIYDWGPREYSTAEAFYAARAVSKPTVAGQTVVNVADNRQHLRQLASDRERLFQAYNEFSAGDLFVRFGRQILVWGETDGFRLLDNINPIDSSFGGFLISLDERRVPLDMLRTQYRIGDIGPFQEAFLEAYGAIDNKVGYYPGTPAGSPWTLPSLGNPSNTTKSFILAPPRTINNIRGGARLVFNALDATFSVAHYYTFEDTPNVQAFTSGKNGQSSVAVPFNDHLPCGDPALPNVCGYPAHAYLTAPKVAISGVTSTFAVPQIYSVVRSELVYFKNEPAFTQAQLDPFIFNPANTGLGRTRNSIATVIGLDANQWIRALNPNQTFFISTQFFYKYIMNGAGNQAFVYDSKGRIIGVNGDREVLPVVLNNLKTPQTLGGRLEPYYIRQPLNQYLQTLFIGTSYRSGTINPGLVVFYDWGGAFLYQPTITFSRDPFRFIVDYSILSSHIYKGGSGVSLLKDRDNVQFRFEYVI